MKKTPNYSKVSIIIPIIRAAGAARTIKAIRENAGIPESEYEIMTRIDHDRIGCPAMVNLLTERAHHDLVCFLADDTIPEPDFLKNSLIAMSNLPDGFGTVALNDYLRPKEELAAHFLASKKMLPFLDGYFFSPEYTHCYCDRELTDKSKAWGRFVFCEDSKLLHEHPIFKGNMNLWDKDYARVYSGKSIAHDELTYDRRMFDFNNRHPELPVFRTMPIDRGPVPANLQPAGFK